MRNILHDLSGENKNQILSLADRKTGRITGIATRQECHSGKGKTHLAFMAMVYDPEGNIFLARRASSKSLWANCWDAAVVSHVLPGESPQNAASRRAKEEIGLKINFSLKGAFYYYARTVNGSENEYCHVMTGLAPDDPVINPVEISEIRKVSFNEMCQEIRMNKKIFTPWLIIALEKFNLSEL